MDEEEKELWEGKACVSLACNPHGHLEPVVHQVTCLETPQWLTCLGLLSWSLQEGRGDEGEAEENPCFLRAPENTAIPLMRKEPWEIPDTKHLVQLLFAGRQSVWGAIGVAGTSVPGDGMEPSSWKPFLHMRPRRRWRAVSVGWQSWEPRGDTPGSVHKGKQDTLFILTWAGTLTLIAFTSSSTSW